MSAAVMSPSQVMPRERKPSVWGKMFSGLKSGSKKQDEVNGQQTVRPAMGRSFPSYDMKSQKQASSGATETETSTGPLEKRPRTMSTTTAVDNHNAPVQRHHGSRAASLAAPSIMSTTTTKSRNGSVSSTFSRRGSKWWRGSNPDDENAPPVPAIDRKFSIFGSHNPDTEIVAAPTAPPARRPSYVPRNAAGSFLQTTTMKVSKRPSKEDLTTIDRKLSVASSGTPERKLSEVQSPPGILMPSSLKVMGRKDSHVGPEKTGMHSMAGICDIIEDVDEEQKSDATSLTTSSKVDTVAGKSSSRADSANGSPELLATRNDTQREPSLIEGTAV